MSAPNPNEQVIEEFLGDEPRAEMWRTLRQALEGRLKEAIATRDQTPETDLRRRAEAEAKVTELRQQVAALAQEEAVTQFVEDSVRATLNRPVRPGSDYSDEFGDED